MMHRDVSGFRPQRDVPRRNEAWTKLVRGNIPARDPRPWIEESLEAEVLLYVAKPATTISDMLQADDGLESMQLWKAGTEVAGAALFAGYRCWVGKLRGYNLATAPMKELWNILTDFGFAIRKARPATSVSSPTARSADAGSQRCSAIRVEVATAISLLTKFTDSDPMG